MMKTSKLIKLLPLTTLLLTGCFDQSISKENFAAKLEEINQNLNAENEKLKKDSEQKMKDVKAANEASKKLKNIMDEIKNMTPPS